MYDPMWMQRHPVEVDRKPGAKEKKASREGSAMRALKAQKFKDYY